MGECGNMPDWHPYNQPQSSRVPGIPGSQPPTTGHMYIGAMSPPALDGINLTAESRQSSSKHPNDQTPFSQRNYQSPVAMSSTACPTSSSLTPGVHINSLNGCSSHYAPGNVRNPLIDGMGTSLDPRLGNVAVMNDDNSHRTGQIAFPTMTNHPNPPNVNVNPGTTIHGGNIVPQNCPIGSMSPGRQPTAYGTCKAPCCNPETNISYQHWEKFNPYNAHHAPSSYRDNVRPTGYPIENRRFHPDMNLRKECIDNKDHDVAYPVEHRRNYPDYKYRKDSNVGNRGYPNNAGTNILGNYGIAGYNCTNDYQKCPYSMKDYGRRANNGPGSKNSGIMKYQEQQNILSQQKYQHVKQMQYQNVPVPQNLQSSSSTSGISTSSGLQNSYYNNGPISRDYSRDFSQDATSLPNRISQTGNSHVHGNYPKYHQIYHQKIAMQRYSVENHMRAFSRIPGYQSHPKYQECVMRYRELLRLQQSMDYHNVIQETNKISSPTNSATTVAPINLQFDQNGVLINSNYLGTSGYPNVHGNHNTSANPENSDSTINIGNNATTNLESHNRFVERSETTINSHRDVENELQRNALTTINENPERYFMSGEKISNDRYETENSSNVPEVRKIVDENLRNDPTTLNSAESTNTEIGDYKNSKNFADKPELDVRQFLANWDESEDEDSTAAATAAVNVTSDVISSRSDDERFVDSEFTENNVENNRRRKLSDERTVNAAINVENSISVEKSSSKDSTEIIDSGSSSTNDDNATKIVDGKKIHCLTTDDGIDDIPTIHIVESLEEGTEIEKIRTVFENLTSTVLNPITMAKNSIDDVNEGETIVLFEETDGVCSKTLEFTVPTTTDGSQVVEGVIASIIDSTIPKINDPNSSDKNDYKTSENSENSEITKVTKNSVNERSNDEIISTSSSTSSSTSGEIIYATSDAVSTINSSSKRNSDETTNLAKQNSFASDESHNHDDISLPDLQTSECTPISTTLNTPIHSDTEESSEHVTDLTISTNPIEIIPNSPIISFTHSPIKIEPYEQLNGRRIVRTNERVHNDSLDFDFEGEVACRENENYIESTKVDEASVVEGLETVEPENSIVLKEICQNDIYNDNGNPENSENVEFYRSNDPLVGTTNIAKSKNDETNVLDVSKINGDDETAEVKNSDGTNVVEKILNDERMENEGCSEILEGNEDYERSDDLEKLCDMTLDESCIIPLIPGEEEDRDEPRMPVSPMEGNCLTKILNDTMPITDLDVLESSDEENIEKTDDDMWMDVHYMDKHLNENYDEKSKNESQKPMKCGKIGKIEKFHSEKSSSLKWKKRSEKIDDETTEIGYGCNLSAEMEFPDAIVEDDGEENFSKEKNDEIAKTETSNAMEKKEMHEFSEETRKSVDFGQRRRISRDEKSSDNEIASRSDVKNTTKTFAAKHCDSNVEIQVSNLNLKIHDNEKSRKDCAIGKTKIQDSSCESVDAIEIKINLSRGEILSHRISNKFIDDDRRKNFQNSDIRENNSRSENLVKCDFVKKRCRRRRQSFPDGSETAKKFRKNDEPRSPIVMNSSAKKIKNRNRRKFRKSMDDELLTMRERSRNDCCLEERNFRLEMGKTLNVGWNRDDETDNEETSNFVVQRDDETKRDKKMASTSKNDFRNDVRSKRTFPSPSYNSSFENSSNFDFDNFDVAPHNSSDTELENVDASKDSKCGKSKFRTDDRRKNSKNYQENREDSANSDDYDINLNTVPIYTTKDGRINYSPNRNYTYRALIAEARKREDHGARKNSFRRSKMSSKNNFRVGEKCKISKKRYDEKNEKIRCEGRSTKSKRGSSGKRRRDETDVKNFRTKKHDDKRKDGKISTEFNRRNDENEKLYSVERRSFDGISASPRSDSPKNFTEIESTSRKIEISRIDDSENCTKSSVNYNNICATKNLADVPKSPEKFVDANDANDANVCKIFHAEKSIISAERNVANSEQGLTKIGCENKSRDSRFFGETGQRGLKMAMPSPIVNLDKRSGAWDIDQDCQTVLSDSGLESSTTYVEASKRTRKIQRWKNSFVAGIDVDREIYSNAEDVRYEPIDLSQEKSSRYFDHHPENPKNRPSNEENPPLTIVKNDNPTEMNSKEKSKETKLETNPENPKISSSLSTKFLQPALVVEPTGISEIVNSLDLAIVNRQSDVSKPPRTKNESENSSKISENLSSSIFSRDRDAKISPSKFSESSTRRASSDDVDDERPRNLFSSNSTFLENSETNVKKSAKPSSSLVDDHDDEEITKMDDNDVPTTENPAVDRNSSTKENFDSYKDFLIDTSTSFPSCLRPSLPEPVNEITTGSENSIIDETSTRFAGESMDFKDISAIDDTSRNYDFSLRRNNDYVGIEDANVGHSLFSSITENAMPPNDDFPTTKNYERFSESPTTISERLSDSAEKAPILSFSGQINDSRDDDCSTKSPPCLVDENSVSNIVVGKSENFEPSTHRNREILRPFGIENSTKTLDSDRDDVTSQPKIPKMIIRNVKSRPGTPTTLDDEKPEVGTSTKERSVFEVKIKSSRNNEKREENKIPKMKIRLDDRQISRTSSENSKISENFPDSSKNSSKSKTKKSRKSSTSRSPLRTEKFCLVGKLSRQSSETEMRLDKPENVENSNASSSYKFTLMEKSSLKMGNHRNNVEIAETDCKHDRIPKLTIKKQELTLSGTTSGCSTKKRRSGSPADGNLKKRKTTSKHSTNKKDENRSNDVKTNFSENEGNADSQNIAEIVPKVIIKRTSPSAEFKCELSKVGPEAITKDSKWQPEVKLQRCWVLDCMAKEPGNGKFALRMLENSLDTKDSSTNVTKSREWKRSVSDCNLEKLKNNRRTFENDKKRRRSLDGFSDTENRRVSVDAEKIVRPEKSEIVETSSKSENRISVDGEIVENSKIQDGKKSRNTEIVGTSNLERTKKIVETTKKCKNYLTSGKVEKIGEHYEENENAVIKLDSSDESQTTIEILAASPDVSQPETDMGLERNSEIVESMDCGTMGKLYSDDAIPTQFELELEIVDNSTVDSLDVPIPISGDNCLNDDTTSTTENLHRLERFKPYRLNDDDDDDDFEKFSYSDESVSIPPENIGKSSTNSEKKENLICSSDLLVKEVLAAKETLKRCLTKANNVSKTKIKPRPKTAAEKKQGLGFHFDDIAKISENPKSEMKTRDGDFDDDGKVCGNVGIGAKDDKNLLVLIKNEKTLRDATEKHEKSRKSWNDEKSSKTDHRTLSRSDKSSKRSGPSSTKTKGKSPENFSRGENSKIKNNSISNESTESAKKDSKNRHREKTSDGKSISLKRESESTNVAKVGDSSSKMKSYKIPRISKSTDRKADKSTSKEEKRKTPSPTVMPVLEPQIHPDFELTGSDRDTSRSPPVITKHEENDVHNELPKKIEENVHSDKLDSIEKKDPEAVTFADIVSQLAYHEKATIRHRRYCTLCERWFPTAARHRRHLTGYQHRHTELTQRRTVHALFMLFTGKPCPRLLPASIVRTDCLPGEPTPLQIAVQDVAISLEDGARAKPKDVSETDD